MYSNKTVLITGASGQLGSEFKKISQNSSEMTYLFTDVDELDITNPNALETYFSERSIDFIFNCAAYTNVDKAETDEEAANTINGSSLKYLSVISIKFNIPIIHISTDYVFDGESEIPYTEDEHVNPVSAYGRSKLLGENYTKDAFKYMIIRTSWLYSSFGHNFVKTMLKLGKERDELKLVADQIGSPTFAEDLAIAVHHILLMSARDIGNFKSGIYHYSNEGSCSWYEFASEILKMANISCNVMPIQTSDYPTPAKRPKFSLLNKTKIKETYHIEIPEWKDSLKRCLEEMSEAVLI